MERRYSKYPVSRLLAESIRPFSATDLSIHLGYKNINKMFRYLDRWLLKGSGEKKFLNRFVERGVT